MNIVGVYEISRYTVMCIMVFFYICIIFLAKKNLDGAGGVNGKVPIPEFVLAEADNGETVDA